MHASTKGELRGTKALGCPVLGAELHTSPRVVREQQIASNDGRYLELS